MRRWIATRANRPHWIGPCWLALALTVLGAAGQTVINEVLFNPAGTPDSPHEYLELRGPPNFLLTNTYLISLEGDTNGNPGLIQDVFNLSGRAIGGNGFLVLLQRSNSYPVIPGCTVLANTGSESGWGSGSGSSIGHVGEADQKEFENGSQTFLLIQTTNPPAIGLDADSNDNGIVDAAILSSWTILDSVGVLDNDGLGDIAYGAINFRRNPQALASGTVVEIGFTPSYVGRTSNSVGSAASAWVVSDPVGTAPNWALDGVDTVPAAYTNALLNHIGGPNFGAPKIPGVILVESGGSTAVNESGGTDSYTLALNTSAAGQVRIRIDVGSGLVVSTDGGNTYGSTRAINLNTNAKTVLVKAIDDNIVDTSPHFRTITHTVTNTLDPAQYPLHTPIPEVRVAITDNDSVLLSELKVNPPGSSDAPCEYVEILGAPSALLTNLYFVAIDGNTNKNPGEATMVVDLSGYRLGTNGLLVIAANGHPYSFPPATTVVLAPQLNVSDGGLGNGSMTFMLVSSPAPILEDDDLDRGNNGTLERLHPDAAILDAVGWMNGAPGDILYTFAVLTQTSGTPDAAARVPGNTTPEFADAWFNGDLNGSSCDAVAFDPTNVSPDFPLGSELTPGVLNDTAPLVSPMGPISGDVGDPTNPVMLFSVDDAETGAAGLTIMATSSKPAVVPSENLIITAGPGGSRTLTIHPVGIGYSTITVAVSDGTTTRRTKFRYAASAVGGPSTRFHTAASDASTAFSLDAQWMIVGDDEDQGLRIYNRLRSGNPLAWFDFTSYLNLHDLEDGSPREVDLEASTRLGNRIFWMGAHSHGALAAVKTNRSRIFATDLTGTGSSATLSFVGRYEWLKVDLINWDSTNGHGKGSNYFGLAASAEPGVDAKAPDGSGFNIEGLSMAPGSSSVAYVGFRAPLVPPGVRAKALIVPVQNFATLAIGNGPPGSARFGAPIELNLGRRGIRSIECTPAGCLIIAGPPGKASDVAPYDFKLFTWTGNAADRPEQRAASLTGLNPESIVELPLAPWTPASQVQLLSDNGTTVFYGDGVEAKHLDERAFRKFRSDWLTLGNVVVPQPAILSQVVSNDLLVLTWTTQEGRTYRLERATRLASPDWTAVPGDVTASDAVASKSDSLNTAGTRFYRVVVVP